MTYDVKMAVGRWYLVVSYKVFGLDAVFRNLEHFLISIFGFIFSLL